MVVWCTLYLTGGPWYRALKSVCDVFISVELTGIWRLHLVYAKKDGKELLGIYTQRFASLTTMLTLLVGAQVATLFSPSRPTETVRTALETNDVGSVAFWAGLLLCIGILCSICSLLCTLTAWSLFSVIGHKNAHILLRSSMLLYAGTLPARTAFFSIYIFIIWLNVFFFVVASWQVATGLVILCFVFFVHIISMYSAVGRAIMFSGAIGDERILLEDLDAEEHLTPTELTEALIEKVAVAKEGDIPVSEQYRIKYQEQLQILEEGGSLQLEELRLPV